MDTTLVLQLGLLAVTSCVCQESFKETVHEDLNTWYQYRLESKSMFGQILDSALPGSEIPVHPTLPYLVADPGTDSNYLRLEVWENAPRNSSPPLNSSNTSPQLRHKLTHMPPDLLFGVSSLYLQNDADSDGFSINTDRYIVVTDPTGFRHQDMYALWVVLINRTAGQPDMIVSNPMAFVILVEHTNSTDQSSAVYVGIIVAFICAIALIIPFTVRTKRRLKQGKPVCTCGSNGSSESEETLSESKEEQIAAIFNESGSKTGAQPMTLQSQAVGSVSEYHFQPRWLDPHYNDAYEHPVYQQSQTPPEKTVPEDDNQQNGSSKSGKKPINKTTLTPSLEVIVEN